MTRTQLIRGLTVALTLTLIGLYGVLISGCAGNQTIPVCRHYAVLGAYVDEDAGYRTRIWWGPSAHPNGHTQHQAYIDGQWQWRCVGMDSVYTCDKDDFEPVMSKTLRDYVEGRFWR